MNILPLSAIYDRDLHVIVSSALHEAFAPLQPNHAKIFRIQVYDRELPPFPTAQPPNVRCSWFPYGSVGYPLSLAPNRNSLARVSRRTAESP